MKQIVLGELPGWKIAEFAANEKIKAREFSYESQVYLLMLGQLLHLFSLNELVDVSHIYALELSRIRGIVPAVVWRKKEFLSVLRAYGIAPGGNTGESHDNMPYLRGFEKYFTEAVGVG